MDPGTKILLVDDEPDITSNLKLILEREGYQVAVAANGSQAMRMVDNFVPDLIVLDILMPALPHSLYQDGREVLRQLRQANNWTPVILLSQLDDTWDIIGGLRDGADDYLNKPYQPAVLLAHIEAVLRRTRLGQKPLTAAQRLYCYKLMIERTSRRAFLNEKELSLTPKAFTLLDYFMTHPDELLTRERLFAYIWGYDFINSRALDTRIAELRRALHDDAASPRFVETIPGQGYRFIGPVTGE
jgi:DNA-binding response OmpR family regulator